MIPQALTPGVQATVQAMTQTALQAAPVIPAVATEAEEMAAGEIEY